MQKQKNEITIKIGVDAIMYMLLPSVKEIMANVKENTNRIRNNIKKVSLKNLYK